MKNDEFLQQTYGIYDKFKRMSGTANRQVYVLRNLFTALKDMNERFAEEIQRLAIRFLEEMQEEGEEHELLISSYQLLSNMLLKMYNNHYLFAADLRHEILEPLIQFTSNFVSTNEEQVKKLKKSLDGIAESGEALEDMQSDYMKLSKTLEKTEANLENTHRMLQDGVADEDDFQRALEKKLELKMTTQESAIKYKNYVEVVNQTWEQFKTTYPTFFQTFGMQEGNRVKFLQTRIGDAARLLKKLYSAEGDHQGGPNLEEKLREINEKFGNNNQDIFAILYKGHVPDLKEAIVKEEFVSYEATRELEERERRSNASDDLKASTGIIVLDKDITQEDLELLESTVKRVLGPAPPDESPKGLDEALKVYENRVFLVDTLRRELLDNHQKHVAVADKNFRELSVIFQTLATSILRDPSDRNAQVLHELLQTSSWIQNAVSPDEEFLLAQLANSKLWSDINRWKLIFRHLLQRRLEEVKSKKKKPTTTIGSLFQRVKGIVKTSAVREEEKAAQLIVLEEMNDYLQHLPDGAEILITLAHGTAAETYDIIRLLERREFLKNQELRRAHSRPRAKKRRLPTDKVHCIKFFVLDFLQPRDAAHLLGVSRQWHAKLSKKVYRLALDRGTLSHKNRMLIWQALFRPQFPDIDYGKLREFTTLTKTKPAIEEIIEMDVTRSMHINPKLKHDSLRVLLKAYANYNKEIEYCQGMNYVMGFILLQFDGEEEISFKFFCVVMDKLLTEVVHKDFTRLRKFFCMLDRLIAIFLPRLAQHFKTEHVDISYFAPSWFITLFTSAYQYTTHSYLLLDVWDEILLHGWKAMFRTAIYVLARNEEKLLAMNFEEMLNFLSEIYRSELFSNLAYDAHIKDPKQPAPPETDLIRGYKAEMARLNLTDNILHVIEADYDRIKMRVEGVQKSP